MEQFYAEQAQGYDSFRKRLLKGREELIAGLQAPPNAVLVDLGGGTGANVEFARPEFVSDLAAWHIVDLAGSLLKVADARIAENQMAQCSYR